MACLSEHNAAEVDAIFASLEQDGGCIVHGLLDEQQCSQLLADFAPALETTTWGADDLGYRDDFYGVQTKRLHGLFAHSTLMETVLLQPLMLTLASRLFLDTRLASDLRLSNAELMVIGEGQKDQVFHTDAASWSGLQRQIDQEILLSANYALTDFTEHNGATRVVPGSHRWPANREPTPDDVCLAVMPRGSALLYTGNLVHSGGNNQTALPRTGLYLGYVGSALRPLENQLITSGPQVLQRLSPEAQRLLDFTPDGFTVYA